MQIIYGHQLTRVDSVMISDKARYKLEHQRELISLLENEFNDACNGVVINDFVSLTSENKLQTKIDLQLTMYLNTGNTVEILYLEDYYEWASGSLEWEIRVWKTGDVDDYYDCLMTRIEFAKNNEAVVKMLKILCNN